MKVLNDFSLYFHAQGEEEYATLVLPGQAITRGTIDEISDRQTQYQQNLSNSFSEDEVQVSIYACNIIDFCCVDLPGMYQRVTQLSLFVGVRAPGDPNNPIILRMIKKYVDKENVIPVFLCAPHSSCDPVQMDVETASIKVMIGSNPRLRVVCMLSFSFIF